LGLEAASVAPQPAKAITGKRRQTRCHQESAMVNFAIAGEKMRRGNCWRIVKQNSGFCERKFAYFAALSDPPAIQGAIDKGIGSEWPTLAARPGNREGIRLIIPRTQTRCY
jgi:hypothetical protein